MVEVGLRVALILVALSAGPLRARLSSVRVNEDSVTVRNFPLPGRRYPFDELSHFEWQDSLHSRSLAFMRTATLWLNDGSGVPIYALGEDRPGGIANLNDQLFAAKRSRPNQR
jgi:hypothetical protein